MKSILLLVGCVVAGSSTWAASPQTSLNTKMPEFTMPPGYECPIFSNSPYADMLNALDKMEDNLNKIFPTCENNNENQKTVKTSIELRNKIFEALKLQSTGQIYKLNATADAILTLTKALQNSLVVLSNSKTSACYKSEAQFRSMIFSINDTFQSLSPLVLDLVSKNPVLGTTLGPALKIFAGADAISKGLTLIEKIAKDSIQFDMTDPELRMNTVKNICQFMKLYNRLDSLRLFRRGEVQSVTDKYLTEIQEKNKKVEELKNLMNLRLRTTGASAIGAAGAALFFANTNETETEYNNFEQKVSAYNSLRKDLTDNQNKIQLSRDIFQSARFDQFPEISRCQVVTSALNSSAISQYQQRLLTFANATKHPSNYQLQIDILKAYEIDIQRAIKDSDRSRCAGLGSDWLEKQETFLATASVILSDFEAQIAIEKGQSYVFQNRELAVKQAEASAAEANYANLKTMLNYIPFESSEIEKRAKGIHKYLFAGPDQVDSGCNTRMETSQCSFIEGISGLAKASYQKYRNQGPVYELILNNQKYFTDAYDKMQNAILKIQRYEDQFVKTNSENSITDRAAFNAAIVAREKNAFSLAHVDQKYMVKGTATQIQLCLNAKQAIDQYVVASTHMMSSAGLCAIIKNVLDQPEVSKKLKDYCLPATDKTPSGLDQLRFKLIGEYDGQTTARQGQVTLTFDRSPKAFLDTLIAKTQTLGCEL